VCWEAEKYEFFFEDVEVERSDAAKLAAEPRFVAPCRPEIAVDDVTVLIDHIPPPAGDVTPRHVTQPIRELAWRLRPVERVCKQSDVVRRSSSQHLTCGDVNGLYSTPSQISTPTQMVNQPPGQLSLLSSAGWKMIRPTGQVYRGRGAMILKRKGTFPIID